MKKNFIMGVAMFTCAVILYSCSVAKSLKEVQDNGFSCTNYQYVPVNAMDKNEVKSMIRNYYQQQYHAIHLNNNVTFPPFPAGTATNPGTGNPSTAPTQAVDSRLVFFTLDSLKRLIYNIERASKDFSAADRQNLGVNIYFASYPQSMHMMKNGIDYTNRHTVVFIPAVFDDKVNCAKDFDLFSSINGTLTSKPTYIDSAFLNNPAIVMMAAVGAGTSSITTNPGSSMNSQNHGTGTPPPPTPTGNTMLDITDPY